MKKFLVSTALVGAAVAATVIWWKRSAPSPDLWDEHDDQPATWPSVTPSFAEATGTATAASVQEVTEAEAAKPKPKSKRSPKKIAEPEAEAS